MDGPDVSSSTQGSVDPNLSDLPPGNHPLEVAAREGIGPLSPLGKEIWHGQAVPCVSCGFLARRDASECSQCGQDLRDEMIERMRAHAGPWYVLEHLRPFPGVSIDLIVRQIRRGVLTETSIIRGPETDFQWRFAVETPHICRYFGRCWNCHEEVSPSDTYCPSCLSNLLHRESGPKATEPPHTTKDLFTAQDAAQASALTPQVTSKLQELSEAIEKTEASAHQAAHDKSVRIGRLPVTLVVILLLAAAITILVLLTELRSRDGSTPAPLAPTPVLSISTTGR